MNLSKQQYMEYAGKNQPKSPLFTNLLKAFFIGGAICALGQGLLSWYQTMGLTADVAAGACSVTLIGLAAVLTGVGVYDDIAKHAGAGTLVPITGFANSVVSAALEFKSEGFVLGMCAKMFTLAGPVIVFGVAASAIYGLICWFMQVI